MPRAFCFKVRGAVWALAAQLGGGAPFLCSLQAESALEEFTGVQLSDQTRILGSGSQPTSGRLVTAL